MTYFKFVIILWSNEKEKRIILELDAMSFCEVYESFMENELSQKYSDCYVISIAEKEETDNWDNE